MKDHVSNGGFLCRPIAHIRTDFPEKFGIPRQSGLLPELESRIVFLPEFRNPDALRGITGFSHLWLLWDFSAVPHGGRFQPMVRPPRLGGNTPVGVFATRSPFRPNPIGLSVVTLDQISWDEPNAPILYVNGADLMNGTPIYDIKPYLPHIDSHPEATGGFAVQVADYALEVVFPEKWLVKIPKSLQTAICEILSQDPRPSYQHDPERVYGFYFADLEIRFTVQDSVLTVCSVSEIAKGV